VLQSRCTDETGYIQPTLAQLIAIRGSNGPFGSIYHLNAIQSWGVDADGGVTNVPRVTPAWARRAYSSPSYRLALSAQTKAVRLRLWCAGHSGRAQQILLNSADGRGLPPGSGTAAKGAQVYAQSCTACHGDQLQGNPRRASAATVYWRSGHTRHKTPIKTVESYWPFATTLFRLHGRRGRLCSSAHRLGRPWRRFRCRAAGPRPSGGIEKNLLSSPGVARRTKAVTHRFWFARKRQAVRGRGIGTPRPCGRYA